MPTQSVNPFGEMFADYGRCEASFAEQNQRFCETLSDLPRGTWLSYNIGSLTVVTDDGRDLRDDLPSDAEDYYGTLSFDDQDDEFVIPVPVLCDIFQLRLPQLFELLKGGWFQLSVGSWQRTSA